MDKELKRQFNYYVKKLKKTLVTEQANREARGLDVIGTVKPSLIKNINYDRVYEVGISRKVGTKTVFYYGEQAVQIQIESMRRRTSARFQKASFIENYTATMRLNGFDEKIIKGVDKTLRGFTSTEISYLMDSGKIPAFNFLYLNTRFNEEQTKGILDFEYLDKNKTKLKEDSKKNSIRGKKIERLVKEKREILDIF